MAEILRALRDGWEKTWPGVHCALNGGAPEFVLAADPPDIGASVPVFYYHTVDPALFEPDLAFLRRNGYATITADALADHLEGIAPAPRRSVVLTFDDGSAGLFGAAFPLLREYGCTAVAFIAPWFHEALTADGAAGARRDAMNRVCTWPEIESMHGSGCLDVQSHTFEHRFVPRWPEPLGLIGAGRPAGPRRDEGGHLSIAEDFRRARECIERRLGKSVRHLAFPRYRGTDEAIALGLAVGYRAFWWGGLPGRPINRPGDPVTHIVRMSGEYVRRLPGEGRASLRRLVDRRCRRQLRSLRSLVGGGARTAEPDR